jgi:ribosomal protein S27AE
VRNKIQGITMKPDFLEVRNTLDECPKCGKRSLAQSGSDKYHCLWCGFYRDISEPEGGVVLLVVVTFVFFLLVSLASHTSSQTNELSSPDSSNIPAVEVSPD